MSKKTVWPKGILLDFYGTIVKEDDGPIATICNEIARASGQQPLPEQIATVWDQIFHRLCDNSHGRDFQKQRELEIASLEHVLSRFEADLNGGELSKTLFDYWTKPAIFPESKKVLSSCNLPICLVSNIDTSDLYSALSYHGLDFELVVTSESCRSYKPRSEPFERALSLLGFSPNEVLHVGDSVGSDVRGAKAMGIPVLWLNHKRKELQFGEPEQPDYIGADLNELLHIFRKTSR
jgi:FMN phosphatase YigB (HAD superfamily)